MRRLLALLTVAAVAAVAPAADPAKPAVEFRMKSATDLLPLVEYGGDLAGQKDAAEQVTAILKLVADNKDGFKGIDLKKPVGGYVAIAENIADSAIVLMVPVADETAFVGAIEDGIGKAPKKDDKGLYTIDVPNIPIPVLFRLANGYCYFTVRSEKGIAKDALLAPKEFFAEKVDGILAVNVHFDRFPADVKKALYGQLELQLSDSVKSPNPAEKAFQKFLVDRAVDIVKTILVDGDKLSLTLSADPKTDDIALELGLTAKPGTTLAKTLSGFADRPSAAAAVGTAKAPAFAFGLNFALPPVTKEAFGKFIDVAVEESLSKANGNDKATAKLVLDAFMPTFKGGEFEIGAAATGPDSKGQFGLSAAVRTTGGKEIDKIARALSLILPGDVAKIKFDAGKTDDGLIHEITTPALAGKKWVAEKAQLFTSDALFAAAVGADATEVKALVSAKPAKTPMLFGEVSVVKMFQFVKEVDKDRLTKAMEEAFGKPARDGDDTIRLTATGGKDFRLKISAKGRALSFLRVVNQ